MKHVIKVGKNRPAKTETLQKYIQKRSVSVGSVIRSPKELFPDFSKVIKIDDIEMEKRRIEICQSVDRIQSALGKYL